MGLTLWIHEINPLRGIFHTNPTVDVYIAVITAILSLIHFKSLQAKLMRHIRANPNAPHRVSVAFNTYSSGIFGLKLPGHDFLSLYIRKVNEKIRVSREKETFQKQIIIIL